MSSGYGNQSVIGADSPRNRASRFLQVAVLRCRPPLPLQKGLTLVAAAKPASSRSATNVAPKSQLLKTAPTRDSTRDTKLLLIRPAIENLWESQITLSYPSPSGPSRFTDHSRHCRSYTVSTYCNREAQIRPVRQIIRGVQVAVVHGSTSTALPLPLG